MEFVVALGFVALVAACLLIAVLILPLCTFCSFERDPEAQPLLVEQGEAKVAIASNLIRAVSTCLKQTRTEILHQERFLLFFRSSVSGYNLEPIPIKLNSDNKYKELRHVLKDNERKLGSKTAVKEQIALICNVSVFNI